MVAFCTPEDRSIQQEDAAREKLCRKADLGIVVVRECCWLVILFCRKSEAVLERCFMNRRRGSRRCGCGIYLYPRHGGEQPLDLAHAYFPSNELGERFVARKFKLDQ